MSEFNSFAQQLDTAFKEARDVCNAALTKVDAAKDAIDGFDRFAKERFRGELDNKLQALRADYSDAQENCKRVIRDTWMEFDRKCDSIKAEFEAAVKQSTRANPEAVDRDTMALIQCGILNTDDIVSLFDRFASESNTTMMRVIGAHAQKCIDQTEDITDRERLTAVYIASNNLRRGVMDQWRVLTDAAQRFSGRVLEGQINYDPVISSKWEEATAGIIEAL